MAGREKHAQRSHYSCRRNKSALNGLQRSQSRQAYERLASDNMKRKGHAGFIGALGNLSSMLKGAKREGETSSEFGQKGGEE